MGIRNLLAMARSSLSIANYLDIYIVAAAKGMEFSVADSFTPKSFTFQRLPFMDNSNNKRFMCGI